jgi:hypothetical protein
VRPPRIRARWTTLDRLAALGAVVLVLVLVLGAVLVVAVATVVRRLFF